jgi:tetraacyldisaccharide 4'-kinase
MMMVVSRWFHDIVSGKQHGLPAGLVRGLLRGGEPIYRAVVGSKNRRFDSGRLLPQRVAAPVVSVGNLTVGGTGKTPLVCWLAEWFQRQGISVTLISRGYGAKPGGPNDEALELAARLPGVPHLQNPDRIAAAKEALAVNPRQVLLLDDAFQHRRIARDLDIVLLDALEPFGYGHLLPRGLLREPVESLARAHVVALSRADAIDAAAREAIRACVQKVAPQAAWLELAHQPTGFVNSTEGRLALDAFAGQRIAAFCGIGNPDGFRHTLASCGLDVTSLHILPDHCAFSPADVARLESWTTNQGNIAAAVCTRKDLVKIPCDTLAGRPLWALEITLRITAGQEQFEQRLVPLVAKLT